MGRIKGGWSLVVGYVSTVCSAGVSSPIWGISARRALWSLNSVGMGVAVVGGGICVSVGMRINQWSSGVLFGVYVGVRGSPTCVSCAAVLSSARGLEKVAWRGEDVACRSPPIRTGVRAYWVVRRFVSQVRVSWYVWVSVLVWCCGR